MPRRRVPFASNEYYHIYNRGHNRGLVFYEERNYEYFLQGVRRHVLPAAAVLAYCLMPTHYHMLVRVKSGPPIEDASALFSGGMQRLLISYTKAMNKAYRRAGALFQGAFQSRHIESAGDLKHVCRYIHTNPVKAGLCTSPQAWPHSNYAAWLSGGDDVLVDRGFIQAQFRAAEEYTAFVQDYIESSTLPKDMPPYLADLDFRSP